MSGGDAVAAFFGLIVIDNVWVDVSIQKAVRWSIRGLYTKINEQGAEHLV
jgi:hypothetical protein